MSARPFHHQRPLAAAAAAYGLGVWAGVSFSWKPFFYLAGLACAALGLGLLPRAGKRRAAGWAAAALFAGMLLGGHAAHPALPPVDRYEVKGVVKADAALRENGTAAAYLTDVRLKNENGEWRLPCVYWTYTPDTETPFLPREGDAVRFFARLYHPSGQVNPYGFDFRLYLLEQGAQAGVSGAAEAETVGHPGRGLGSALYRLRSSLARRARQVFGQESALPEALLLGSRQELPQETQKSFADAGAAHLLAVSGLHVGLLSGVVLLFLRRWLSPRWRLLMMSGFLLLYCALLEFHAPVVRASLLLLVDLYRRTVRRAPDGLTALCAAFWLLLIFRPLDLFSASFQLSFCAVLGMTVLGPALKKALARIPSRFVREGWQATLSATAGVALPTAQLFHRFSLVGLLINPFLCALFGVLLPVYAAVLLAGCAYLPAGVWLGGIVGNVTRGLVAAVEWASKLPLAVVKLPALPWYCVAALAAACAILSRYCLGSKGIKRLAALGLVMLAFGVWHLTLCRDVQYIQLAMGQADAALILDGQETLLIDAGDYGGDIASYLLSTGRQADRVILTHLHSDHCLGLREVMEEEIPIGAVYLPEGAEEQAVDPECLKLMEDLRGKGVPVHFLAAGDEMELPRVRVTVAWPYRGTVRASQDANRYSLAALCDLDGVKLLATGDLTGDYEQYAALDADILKVAHHGSKNSTGEAFLSAVTPRVAIVTASPVSDRLPNPATVERLRAAGADILTTARAGAVTVTVRGGEGIVSTFLKLEERK